MTASLGMRGRYHPAGGGRKGGATTALLSKSGATKGVTARFVLHYLAVRKGRAVTLAFVTGDLPAGRIDSTLAPLLARLGGAPAKAGAAAAGAAKPAPLPAKGDAKEFSTRLLALVYGKDEAKSGVPSLLTINKSDAAFYAAFEKADLKGAARLAAATAAQCRALAAAVRALAPADPTLLSITGAMRDGLTTMGKAYDTYATGIAKGDRASLTRGDALLDRAGTALKAQLLRVTDLAKQLGID